MTNADPRLAKPNRSSLCWDYTVGRYLDDVDGVYLDSLGTAMSGFNNVREDHLAVMTEPLVYDEATARPCERHAAPDGLCGMGRLRIASEGQAPVRKRL